MVAACAVALAACGASVTLAYAPGVPVPAVEVAAAAAVVAAPTAVHIPASEPIAMRVYTRFGKLVLNDERLYALGCGKKFVYPETGPTVTAAFYCSDYGLPGTQTPSFGVVTGHSSLTRETVMNTFMTMGEALVGGEVWIRTRTSGARWLIYSIVARYLVDKDRVGWDVRLWGGNVRNRIVFITCEQNVGESSTQNVGFVSVLTRVE